MEINNDSIEKLRGFKNQLSSEINQNFNDARFNLVVAVSDAALNMLFEEMMNMITPTTQKTQSGDYRYESIRNSNV